MNQHVKGIERDVAPYLKKIEELKSEYLQRLEARQKALSTLTEAGNLIAPLVGQRDALRAEYQDATFEEDAARIREVSNQRKALDKEIATAQKAIDRARKAFEKVDFDEDVEAKMLGHEIETLAHEVTEYIKGVEEDLITVANNTRGSLSQLTNSLPSGTHEGIQQVRAAVVKERRQHDPVWRDQHGGMRESIERARRAEEKRAKESVANRSAYG